MRRQTWPRSAPFFFYFFLFFFTVPLKSDFAATNKQHLVCGLG